MLPAASNEHIEKVNKVPKCKKKQKQLHPFVLMVLLPPGRREKKASLHEGRGERLVLSY
jgi:hypothetical protein